MDKYYATHDRMKCGIHWVASELTFLRLYAKSSDGFVMKIKAGPERNYIYLVSHATVDFLHFHKFRIMNPKISEKSRELTEAQKEEYMIRDGLVDNIIPRLGPEVCGSMGAYYGVKEGFAAWLVAQAASRRSLADTRTALTLGEARWVSRHGQKWLGGIEDDRYTGREVYRDLVTAVGLPGPLDEAIRVEGIWRWGET